VREDLRGTYAGLASEPSIAHLKSLGVTTVGCSRCTTSPMSSSSPSAG
jgi:hypothetical protein